MSYQQSMDEQLLPVLRYLEHERPGGLVGVYLFGSAVSSGLRPDSDIDIDLMMLTRRSMTTAERRGLVDVLLAVSGWRGHTDHFPDAVDRRPIELTNLVTGQVESSAHTPLQDFEYGEWLRGDLLRGHLPAPAADPDVVILMATALQSHRVLFGPDLDTVLAPVPREALRDAVLATVPDVLAGLAGDERNALLTLARTLVTLDTGRIVAKDTAVDMIAGSLADEKRVLLERARDEYRGTVAGEWNSDDGDMAALAGYLARRAELSASREATTRTTDEEW